MSGRAPPALRCLGLDGAIGGLHNGLNWVYSRAILFPVWRNYGIILEVSMFDSLADRMKQDQKQEVNATERTIRIIATIVIAAAVFGGLYFVVRLLE